MLTPVGDYPAERPVSALASRGEVPSAEAAQELAQVAASGSVRLTGGSAHGLSMLEGEPSLASVLDEFVGQASGAGAAR